jgi:hypothetical protein
MAYDPPPGTIPAKALEHLRSLPPGTSISNAELAAAIGFEIGAGHSPQAYLSSAVSHGAIRKLSDPQDSRRVRWALGDGVPLVATKDDDPDQPEHMRKHCGPQTPRIDKLITDGGPAVKKAVKKLAASRVMMKVETTYGTDPEPGTVSTELLARRVEIDPIIGRTTTRVELESTGYEMLASVLRRAFHQAAAGKGAERHSSGEPFHEQPICAINRLHGSIDGALFQAAKKAHEARRMPLDRAVAELLGAINYLAACVILVEEGILDNSTTTTKAT